MASHRSNPWKGLQWLLNAVGILALLAFVAAVMPESWMVRIAKECGIEPFPSAPLTFYLARHLSLLYGFIGIGLLVLARDLERYLPLAKFLAYGTICFGALQFVTDSISSMPLGWSLWEATTSITGGVWMVWLCRPNHCVLNHVKNPDRSDEASRG